MRITTALGITVLVACFLVPAAGLRAEEGAATAAGQGKRAHMRQKLLSGAWLKRIDARLQRLNERLTKHPKASAEVKAAVGKIIGDLQERRTEVEKLMTCVQAKDKAGAKAIMAEIRAGRTQCRADREALRELIKAQREARRAAHAGGAQQ